MTFKEALPKLLLLGAIPLGFAVNQKAQAARFELDIGVGYAGGVRWVGNQGDLYEGLGGHVLLGFFVSPRAEWIFSYSYGDAQANYATLSPARYFDHVGTLAYRRYFGSGHGFLQLGADYDMVRGDYQKNGYGPSFGGGLTFKLAGKLAIGTTTLYSARFFSSDDMWRRCLSQTLDLKIQF